MSDPQDANPPLSPMPTVAEALIVVDVQHDFLPDGQLPVPEGDAVVPVINRLMPRFGLVVASQDWHPANHGSFASQHTGYEPLQSTELNGLPQILWPDHCVQHTAGAAFASGLHVEHFHKVVRKGSDPDVDSYSAFFDNGHRCDTGLHAFLSGQGIRRVALAGLAFNVCVKFTALDACKLGYEVRVIEDTCRGVELEEGELAQARQEIQRAGASFTNADAV